MNRCPITYNDAGKKKYSDEGLKILSPQLKELNDLGYTKDEQVLIAALYPAEMAVAGVQPKYHTVLNTEKSKFEVAKIGGRFIMKPQHNRFPEIPENEDLTMKLAKSIGIEVPVHGLVYSRDGSLTYFIKRFDRLNGHKYSLEDFAQLTGRNRYTKYESTMEEVAEVVLKYATDKKTECTKLLLLTLFNFVCGNNDMHLKNFSLIIRNNLVELAPAYDLLNLNIISTLPGAESALPLNENIAAFEKKDLIDYYGIKILGLEIKDIDAIMHKFSENYFIWKKLISISFLSEIFKGRYQQHIDERFNRLGLL